MKIYFLLNPSRVKRRWDWHKMAAREARRYGWTPFFGEVDRGLPDSTARLLDQAFAENCSRIVVVGGDGSLHRVINLLAQRKKLQSAELAVVPAGTCNDFARFLGLSRRRFGQALRLACSGKAQATDLGLIDSELFINNAGFGRRPAAPLKRWRAIQSLRTFRPTVLRAMWDNGFMEGSFYMALVCNAPYFSGGLHFSKKLNLQDGLLDIFLFPAMPKWKILPLIALGRLGRPAHFKRLVTLRVPRMEIEADSDLWPVADGEPPTKAARRTTFAVSPEKAMIVTPN